MHQNGKFAAGTTRLTMACGAFMLTMGMGFGFWSKTRLTVMLGFVVLAALCTLAATATRDWKPNPGFVVISGAGFYSLTQPDTLVCSLIYFGSVFLFGLIAYESTKTRNAERRRSDASEPQDPPAVD